MKRLQTHRKLGALVVAATLLGLVVVAGYFVVEAFEERDAADHAADLQVAALNVSAMTLNGANDSALEGGVGWAWIAELRSDPTNALHSLSVDEAAATVSELDTIANHGEMLLRGEPVARSGHRHEELQGFLAEAVERSADDAVLARRQAYGAVGTVLAVMIAFCIGMLRRRYRRQAVVAGQQAQAHEGKRLQRLLNDSPDIFLVIDPAGRSTYESASAARLLRDESNADRLVDRLLARASERDRDRLGKHLGAPSVAGETAVFQLTDLEGNSGWFNIRVSDLTADDLVAGHLITVSEISREVELQNELRTQAETDHLTDLPNRRTLDSSLEVAAELARTSASLAAFAILDLDGFKEINDSLGHQAGDEILMKATQRLATALQGADILLRLGGDEFGVIMIGVSSADEALGRSRHLLSVFDEPFQVQNHRLELLRASVGVAVADPADSGEDLVIHADIAMYQAKRTGGSTAVVFESFMEDEASANASVTRALRSADYDEEFHLVFQPIVDATSREVASLEALLRWESPLLGRVGPDVFIPLAEKAGEICRIGGWVLHAVCAQLSHWMQSGLDDSVTVSFNVSARQLSDDRFVSEVLSTAKAWDIPPGRLVIEVTESSVIEDDGVATGRLSELRAAGFKVSIDDFGSGYSNLGQLLHVPLDNIKVDRSLLLTLSDMRDAMGGDPTMACSVMEAVVSIAGVLGAPVVAEGVETEDQLASLAASGITYIQGYYTGRPMEPEQAAELLKLAGDARPSGLPIDRLAA